MDKKISKLYTMLDCFKLTGTMSGKQKGGGKTVSIFVQSHSFNIEVQINKVNKAHHFQEDYVVIRAFDKLKGKQFIHTMIYLEDLDDEINLIKEMLEEHTHTTL